MAYQNRVYIQFHQLMYMSYLRGPLEILNFFFIQSFWNFHTICEIELRSDFFYNFHFFKVIFAFFFQKKKSHFSHSTQKNRSRWVFIVQIWFTNQNEAKSIRKRISALFFLIKSELLFISLLIEKNWNPYFFRQLFDFRSILQKKTVLKMKNPELSYYSLSLQLCFDIQVISVA